MKNIRINLIFLVAVVAANFTSGQTPNYCGTMQNITRQMQNNPAMQQQFADMQEALHELEINTVSRADQATYTTIYIPVVFHVVHNGDALGTGENITDAQCISQIAAMNDQFNARDVEISKVPAAFASLVATTNFQFCLAKFDPDGNPTTGIVRHQLANATWDTENDIDQTLKPATIWDHTKYLNIWSVRMGGTGSGTLLGDGVLAYSSLPYFGNANADGVIARYNTIGTTGSLLATYREGKTVTHEVGHWLGLLHIWGDDNGLCAGQANAGSDYVADTPDQADLNFGCPTFPHISCNNGPNGDMFMNYMDYSDDNCRNMFTNGQSTNMHSAVDNFRAAIKTASTECFFSLDGAVLDVAFPKDTICNLNFYPVITIKNEGLTTLVSGKLYFQIDGDVVQIFNWNGSLATQEQVQVTLPLQQVFITGNHTFDVTLGNLNGQVADNYSGNDSKSITFYAYNGSAGAAIPFTEGFEGAFPATNWSIYNPNNDVVLWQKNQSYGGYGTSVSCVSIDNRAYGTNPNKKKDAFITDAYDLSSVAYPELKFDVAYAPYDSTHSDSLNVYYSLNCGSSWTKVWNQKGSDVATAPAQTTSFTPANNQWKTVAVPLVNVSGQNKVSFKFENVTGWGNAMYIDNVNLQNNPTLSVNEIQKVDVQIFPNPASNMVGVRLPVNHPFNQLQLINTIGQVVYETAITDNAIVVSVDQLNNGLYLLHFQGEKNSQTEKLLIAK